jgi:hypothetical protein
MKIGESTMPVLGGLAGRAARAAQADGAASPFARLLRAQGPQPAAAPSPATEPPRHFESQVEDFRRSLLQALHEAGVDTREEIRLEPDGAGGVRLDGVHSDWGEIQRVLAERPDLVRAFHDLQRAAQSQYAAGTGGLEDAAFGRSFSVTLTGDVLQVAFD